MRAPDGTLISQFELHDLENLSRNKALKHLIFIKNVGNGVGGILKDNPELTKMCIDYSPEAK